MKALGLRWVGGDVNPGIAQFLRLAAAPKGRIWNVKERPCETAAKRGGSMHGTAHRSAVRGDFRVYAERIKAVVREFSMTALQIVLSCDW
jgi:hypothetical protein